MCVHYAMKTRLDVIRIVDGSSTDRSSSLPSPWQRISVAISSREITETTETANVITNIRSWN